MRAAQASGEQKLTRAFEELYQGAATGLVASSSAESFEAIKMLKTANPTASRRPTARSYGRNKLAMSLQQIAQLIKADLGVRDRLRRRRWLGYPRQPGRRPGPARRPPRRTRRRARCLHHRPRRPDARRGADHHERIRTHGEGERHQRNRSRTRHRDDDHGRQRRAAERSTAGGRASHRSSGTRGGTSPSRPTSARCSARCSRVTSGRWTSRRSSRGSTSPPASACSADIPPASRRRPGRIRS